MNNEKKGFTLIELLAVIIVIAVIALITVPVVSNTIETSRKGTFLRSAEGIRKISSNYYISNSSKFSNNKSLTFDCDNGRCKNIFTDKNGKTETLDLGAEGTMGAGYVKIYSNGNVEFLLSNGKYCAEKKPNNEEVKIYNNPNCEGIIVDNEKIEIKSIETVSTTSSIRVYVDVTVGESGVSKYEFYIDNELKFAKETTDTNYTYTFDKLTGKKHTIKVKVYNGMYGKPNEDLTLSMDEKEIEASLLDFGTITIAPSSTKWETSKTYAITSTDKQAKIQYKVELGDELKQDWIDYSSEITVNWQSTTLIPTNICARLNDGTNTSEEICFTETKIDTTAPSVPTDIKVGDINLNVLDLTKWQNKDVYFPLYYGEPYVSGSVDNESGIARYEISEDNINWHDWSDYSLEGVYKASETTKRYYRAVNNVGLASPSTEVDIKIDKISPTITYNYNAVSDQGGYGGAYYMGCFNGGITPTLTLSDTGGSGLSGNNQIAIWKDETWINNAVSIGNNQWNIPMTEEGRYIPHVIARDNAGNVSQGTRTDTDESHLTVWDIDTSTPTMSVNLNGYTPGSWTNGSVAIALIGSNGGCDTGKYYWYSVNDGDWVHFGTGDVATYNITNDANYNIKFLITDGFGRWGTQTQNYSIKIDKTNPTVSYSLAGGTYNSYQTVRITPNDENYLSMAVHVYKNSALVYSGKVDEKSTNSTSASYYDVSLDSDGTWTIYTTVYDKALNTQNQNPNNGSWYYQTYVIEMKETCLTSKTYQTGDAVTCGGYNWHVIGDTGTQVTLLMDANQLGSNSTMTHCTNDTDASTDCGVDSTGKYYVYSWDKSKIRTYLNGQFLTDLESKITNDIVSTPICADPSKNTTGGLEQSYG